MPQSDHWAVPYVVETAIAIDPSRVLDLGIGMGQYGLHLRQSLDIARGRLAKGEWKLRLDGVEIFEAYRTPLWEHFYDQVTVAEANQFLASSDQHYDLVLICDVIEHFSRSDAQTLLTHARRLANWIIVTTPSGEYPQGAVFGNEAEIHRSQWSPADFEKVGAFTHGIGATFLAVVPGEGNSSKLFKPGDLPTLFRHTAGSLMECARLWLPQMLRSRFRK